MSDNTNDTDDKVLWVTVEEPPTGTEIEEVQRAVEGLDLPYEVIVSPESIQPIHKSELITLLENALDAVEGEGS